MREQEIFRPRHFPPSEDSALDTLSYPESTIGPAMVGPVENIFKGKALRRL